MNNIILLFACIFCMNLKGNAQPQTKLLEGTIQQYPIILELSFLDDNKCSVRYFYEKQRKDIELSGTVDNNGNISVVTEGWSSGSSNAIPEKLDLKPKDGRYTGTWSNRKKVLPVHLKEIDREKIKNPFEPFAFIQQLKKEDPYNYIRTSALEFIKDSTSRLNNCTLDWYHEKYSGTVLFRINKGYEASARNKINNRLAEEHITCSINALECSSTTGNREYNQTVHHFFANNNLLSVNLMTSYYCGGAHPDFYSKALNFDTRSGQQLALDEVFWFGKENPPAEDTDEWYHYRDKIFAPRIVSLLKQYHPEHMQKPLNTEEECDYTDTALWKFPNWYFTSKGLYVGAGFPRAERVCDGSEWAVIPYHALKQYVDPKSNLVLPP